MMDLIWDNFKKGKCVVWCSTEEKAEDFIKECYKRGLKFVWNDEENLKDIEWTKYQELTCYSYNYCNVKSLGYSSKGFYSAQNYEIVEWEIKKPYDAFKTEAHYLKSMFKPGDMVEAIDNHYSITSKEQDYIGEVTDISGDRIKIKTISCKIVSEGTPFDARAKHFKKIPASEAILKASKNKLETLCLNKDFMCKPKDEFTFEEILKLKDGKVYKNTNIRHNVKTIKVTDKATRITYANSQNHGVIIPNDCTFKLASSTTTDILKRKRYKICSVVHEENGKRYDFIPKEGTDAFRRYFLKLVVCDTIKGTVYGKCVEVRHEYLTSEEAAKYKRCWLED